ncbi:MULTISPECIES: acyl carrier protein [Amycolatopsis]|uniref:Carrier domain-containing protein n=1 Tax=Amycolatopsis bullii TaxID=941987 RepID=A0ABQ3KIA4_9PSEU|nr:acyl carrier protein [Amycolatopsis bullii]GHG12134.1 hypothetical protein GCM10017567_31880 [Amycolatopsis bullii]
MIAGLLVKVTADAGGGHPAIDDAARHQDLAELGLGSLDWIKLAVLVANETGLELPDEALTDARRRTIAGWADALASVSAHRGDPLEHPIPSRGKDEANAG